MKIYDISRPLSAVTAVWPGDAPFKSEWTMSMNRGDSVNVGAVHMSVHASTHADAPLHFLADGLAIDQIDLGKFIGPAAVIDVGEAEAITAELIDRLDHGAGTRVLFRTAASSLGDDEWPASFAYLSPAAAELLGSRGVELVGIDTPSVDPAESKTLAAHKILLQHQIVVLENLFLRDVPPGRYELIALPLKLVGLDASPVRAVLRSLER